ncbi:MAG: hypothetical protein ABEK01_01215 [Candidatus Nanohaloarchaea archaeon]
MEIPGEQLKYGSGTGLGLLISGWAASASYWRGYMSANPEVGTVSGGSPVIVAALFVLGIVLAQFSFIRALEESEIAS